MTLTQKHTPKELLELGNSLRDEDIILWCIIRSRGAVRYISLMTGLPPSHVEEGINFHVNQGALTIAANGAAQLNKQHDRYPLYQELKLFYQKFEVSVYKKYPDAKWEPGHFSRPVANQLELEAKKPSGKSTRPTEKQTEMLHLIMAKFKTEVFRSIDFARAQGYAGTTRATGNYLGALEKKGLLENVGIENRSPQWRLTNAGVEWLETGRWDDSGADEKARGRAYEILKELGEATTRKMAEELGVTASGAHRQMSRLMEKGYIDRVDGVWYLKG